MLDLLGGSRQSNGLRNVLLPVVLTMTKQTIKEYCINLGVPTTSWMLMVNECFFFINGHPYWIQSISGGLPKKMDIWEPNFNWEFEE